MEWLTFPYLLSSLVVLIQIQWNPSFNSQGKRLKKTNYYLSYGRWIYSYFWGVDFSLLILLLFS